MSCGEETTRALGLRWCRWTQPVNPRGCVPVAGARPWVPCRACRTEVHLADDQWALLEPVVNAPGKRGRKHGRREDGVDALDGRQRHPPGRRRLERWTHLPQLRRPLRPHRALGRGRRLAKSFENTTSSATGLLQVACIATKTRHLSGERSRWRPVARGLTAPANRTDSGMCGWPQRTLSAACPGENRRTLPGRGTFRGGEH